MNYFINNKVYVYANNKEYTISSISKNGSIYLIDSETCRKIRISNHKPKKKHYDIWIKPENIERTLKNESRENRILFQMARKR